MIDLFNDFMPVSNVRWVVVFSLFTIATTFTVLAVQDGRKLPGGRPTPPFIALVGWAIEGWGWTIQQGFWWLREYFRTIANCESPDPIDHLARNWEPGGACIVARWFADNSHLTRPMHLLIVLGAILIINMMTRRLPVVGKHWFLFSWCVIFGVAALGRAALHLKVGL